MPILESNISAVTVYDHQARITRIAKIELTTGQHTLSIIDLPDLLEEKSVRVDGRGVALKLLSVDVEKKSFLVAPNASIAQLEKQLTDLQPEIKVIDDNLATLVSKLTSLQQLQQNTTNTFPQALSYGRVSLEQLDNTLKYINKELLDTQAAIRELNNRKTSIVAQTTLVNNQLNLVKSGETKSCWVVEVVVEADADTSLELEVSYLVYGASWSPLYDVRLVENQVTLSYLANVKQRTGEAWVDVQLSLSTAQPAISTVIPELTPWYIPAKPRPQPAQSADYYNGPLPSAAPGGRGGGYNTPLPAPAAPPPPAIKIEVATLETSSSGGSVVYHVPKSTSIPNDGTPHKTMVALIPLEAKLEYVTVPKLAAEAYLRATIKNTSDNLFLAGSANIFHNSDFIGTTQIATIAANEEFKIQLGVDKRLKIVRKLSERTVSKTFFGGSKRYTFAYTTTITNNLKIPIKVVVHDQLPIAYSEEIKIKPGDILPKPIEQDDSMQMIKWELDFKPEEKRDISISFILECPKETTIPGID